MNSLNRRIYAHRGLWKTDSLGEEYKNTLQAFEAAAARGFSIETDIRDFNGEVVIGHDPLSSLTVELNLILSKFPEVNFALNVKSDGLLKKLIVEPREYYQNSFFFDLSIPEYIKYVDSELILASRESEFEQIHLPRCKFIWFDYFFEDWYLNSSIIEKLRTQRNPTVIVSPELHGRPHMQCWKRMRDIFINNECLSICTDFPEDFLITMQTEEL